VSYIINAALADSARYLLLGIDWGTDSGEVVLHVPDLDAGRR
jgi:hypothetical protein